MKIYNVLWEDRHTDTTATPFFDFESAKKWAREQAQSSARHKGAIDEENLSDSLFYIQYSISGDCLWITEHEIKGENK